jgi:hypothetical protein
MNFYKNNIKENTTFIKRSKSNKLENDLDFDLKSTENEEEIKIFKKGGLNTKGKNPSSKTINNNTDDNSNDENKDIKEKTGNEKREKMYFVLY